MGQVLYAGDPHGRFGHLLEAVELTMASALVLLGDMQPSRPLQEELVSVLERGTQVWFIHGNHDADSDDMVLRVWGSTLADRS